MELKDKQFVDAAISQGIDTNPADFTSLSLGAMKLLQENGKPNLIHTWAKCVFGDNGKPLIPIHRMPFGLIQYQMQFFASTNVMQVGKKLLMQILGIYFMAGHIYIYGQPALCLQLPFIYCCQLVVSIYLSLFALV